MTESNSMRLLMIAGVAATLLAALGWNTEPDGLHSRSALQAASAMAEMSRVRPIEARGRLRPAGGVIRLAGPERPGAVVAELAVNEGDGVSSGAVVALLEGTQGRRALVRKLRAEASHAAVDLSRMEKLHQGGIVSSAERDAAALRAEVARAELDQAQADLDASTVRASIDGRVLAIHTRPGERIGADGIVDLGDTDHMEVVAEVYETDIAQIKVGQEVTVTATALPEPLRGKVDSIGSTIGRMSVFSVDPAADADARVVEVHIRLDGEASVASLTNLQVDVEFDA